MLTIASFIIEHGVHAKEDALLRAIVSLSAIFITMALVLVNLSANARLRESERKQVNLSRFFSPQVIEQLVQVDVPLSVARHQPAVIMFADMIGFTAYTSQNRPQTVITTLRELLALMSKAVFARQGTIDKFLGDGLLAVFGSPALGPNPATDAAMCALDIVQSVDRWNAERCQRGEAPLQVAIGLHSGEVVMGDVGCDARLEFTIIGDAVNIASRVEAYCRTLNAQILVTADFIISLRGEGRCEPEEYFVDQGWHVLRGRTEPIRLYGLGRQAERVPASKKDDLASFP
jgi:adenylate cyclase